jgi:hypothetical protein
VYANPDHKEALGRIREQLIEGSEVSDAPPALGDAFPLPRALTLTRDQAVRDYGASFADGVFALEPNSWSEPIESKFGFHLVKIVERLETEPASYEEVRGKLPLALLSARKQRAVADFLKQAEDRYRIEVDGKRTFIGSPSGQVAPARVPEGD